VQQTVAKAEPKRETKSRDITEAHAFTFLPYIDQYEMFENVYDHLGRGGTIGIFPGIHTS